MIDWLNLRGNCAAGVFLSCGLLLASILFAAFLFLLWLHDRFDLLDNALVERRKSCLINRLFVTLAIANFNVFDLQYFLVSVHHTATDTHHLIQLSIVFVNFQPSLQPLQVSLG